MANNQVPCRGVLYTNHKKQQPKHPDMTGEYVLQDGTVIKLSAWLKSTPRGNLISLAEDTYVRKPQATNDYPREVNNVSEDDIPF